MQPGEGSGGAAGPVERPERIKYKSQMRRRRWHRCRWPGDKHFDLIFIKIQALNMQRVNCGYVLPTNGQSPLKFLKDRAAVGQMTPFHSRVLIKIAKVQDLRTLWCGGCEFMPKRNGTVDISCVFVPRLFNYAFLSGSCWGKGQAVFGTKR